jgi:hypothetical protein
MTQRLTIREGQTAEAARRQFDGQLGVSAWATPSQPMSEPEPRDVGAPWWWEGAEEASDSFLTSMGVTL